MISKKKRKEMRKKEEGDQALQAVYKEREGGKGFLLRGFGKSDHLV